MGVRQPGEHAASGPRPNPSPPGKGYPERPVGAAIFLQRRAALCSGLLFAIVVPHPHASPVQLQKSLHEFCAQNRKLTRKALM